MGTKKCTKCGEVKELGEFYTTKRNKSGYRSSCKVCTSKYHQERYTGNKEHIYSMNKRWVKNNPEKVLKYAREYRDSNRDKYREWQRSWGKTEYGRKYRKTMCAKRRAKKILADIGFCCKKVYFECPEGLHVDHIIPLNGETVCGLHVPWNLQYLTPEENMKKSNKLLEEYCD